MLLTLIQLWTKKTRPMDNLRLLIRKVLGQRNNHLTISMNMACVNQNGVRIALHSFIFFGQSRYIEKKQLE